MSPNNSKIRNEFVQFMTEGNSIRHKASALTHVIFLYNKMDVLSYKYLPKQ